MKETSGPSDDFRLRCFLVLTNVKIDPEHDKNQVALSKSGLSLNSATCFTNFHPRITTYSNSAQQNQQTLSSSFLKLLQFSGADERPARRCHSQPSAVPAVPPATSWRRCDNAAPCRWRRSPPGKNMGKIMGILDYYGNIMGLS